MNGKWLGVAIVVLGLALLAYAITLTADATDKVVVRAAFKTNVCEKGNASNCKELVFGIAEAFPKGYKGENSEYKMLVFEMDNIIYRENSASFTYFPTDSSDPASYTQVTIKTPELSENSLSIVNNDGTETFANGNYQVTLPYSSTTEYNEELQQTIVTSYTIPTDTIYSLNFTVNGTTYELKDIVDKSSFTWIPGTGKIEVTQ